jgi:hypothetical protein
VNDPRNENLVLLREGDEVRQALFPDWDKQSVTSEPHREKSPTRPKWLLGGCGLRPCAAVDTQLRLNA